MKEKASHSTNKILRQKAEELLKNKPIEPSNLPSELDILKLIHELELQKIELELQNEELLLAKKKAEADAEKYANLYDFAPSGYFTLSNKGEIIKLNFSAANLLGKERSFLLKKSFSQFVSDKKKPIFNIFLKELFESKTKQTCELILTGASNFPTYVYLTGIVKESGDQCLLTMVDISNQEKAEDTLKKSQLLLQSTLESQKETIIFSIDKNYNYLSFNNAHLNVMKQSYNTDVKVGMNILECISSIEDRKFAKENYDRALAGESHSNIRIFGAIEKAHYESFFNPIIDINNKVIGATGLARNITKRIKDQDNLKISEENYRTLFESNRDSITIVRIGKDGKTGNFIKVNPATIDVLGFSETELLSMGIRDLEILSEKKRKERIATLQSQGRINFETTIKNKKGNLRNVEIESIIINFENETAVMNITRDITERKQTEGNIRKAQENLTTILEAIPDLLFEVDLEGQIYHYQAHQDDLLAVPASVFMGKLFQEVLPVNVAKIIMNAIEEANKKGWSTGNQYSLDLPQGMHWFELSVSPIKESGNKEKHFILLARDITERKKSEEELRESEERLSTIFNVANSGIVVTDSNGKFINFNDKWPIMLGYTREELNGKSIFDIAHPDELKKSKENLDRIINSDQEPYIYEKHVLRKDKSSLWGEVSISKMKNPDDATYSIIAVITDITERKKAEESLQKSQEKLRGVFDLANSGIILTDLKGKYLLFNNWCSESLGYTRQELNKLSRKDLTHPDDLESSNALFNQLIEGKIDRYQLEKRFVRKDKSFFWAELSVSAIKDKSNKVVNAIGILNDITERKKTQKALQDSERFAHATFDALSAHIAILDENGLIISVNNAWRKFMESNTPEGTDIMITEGFNYLTVCQSSEGQYSEEAPKMIKGIRSVMNGETTEFSLEYPCHSPTEKKWFNARVTRFTQEGDLRIVVAHENITERMLAEEKLKQSEARLIAAQVVAKIGNWETDFTFTDVIWSKENCKIFGIDPEATKLSLKDFFAIVHPEDRTILETTFVHSINKNTVNSFEHRIITPDGILKYVEERWEIICDSQGKPCRAVGTCQDITDRKQAEQALENEKRRLSVILIGTGAGTWEWNIQTGAAVFNKQWAEIIGYTLEEIAPITIDTWKKYTHPEDLKHSEKIVEKHFQGKLDYYESEFRMKHKNGDWVWVLGRGKVNEWDLDGKPLLMSGIHQDITKRKQAEEKLIESESLLQKTQNLANLGSYSIDLVSRKWTSTAILDKIFGIDANFDKSLDGWMSIINPESRSIIKDYLYNEVIGKKIDFNKECKIIKIDSKEERWIHGTGEITYNDEGQPIGIIGSVQDITQRKQIEQNIIENQKIFRAILDNAPVGIWMMNEEGRMKFVNKLFCDATGISEEQFIGAPDYAELYEPDIAATCKISDQEAFAKENPHISNEKLLFTDGKIHELEIIKRKIIDEHSGSYNLIGISQDITERKSAEKTLRESEEKYRGLVENSPDGVVIYIDGKIVYINDEGVRMLRAKNKEEIIGKPIMQFIHQDSVADVIKRMNEVVTDNYLSSTVEEKFITIDGIPFDVEIKGIPTIYNHKAAVQVIVHDITQRKQSSLELNKINRVYALISQINNLIIRTHSQKELFQEICDIAVNFGKFRMSWIGLINDNHKIITEAYAGFENGYFTQSNITTNLDEPEGRGPTGVATREGRTVICNDIAYDKIMKPWRKEALKRGYSSLISIPITVRNKTIGAFNLYSQETNFFSSEEEILILEKIILNISFALEKIQIEEDRKHTEEKIRQLSRAVEQSPVSIVITNTKGNIEYVNPKFTETTGYSYDEVIGQNPRMLKSEHTSSKEYKKLWQTLLEGNEWHGEFHNIRKDGVLYWESASISPILNVQGIATHYIAIKEDITTRKQVEKELIKAKEKAEESDRLKLAFLANMSHEIRTPMNGILGFTELLKEPKLSGEEQQEYIEIIEKSGKRMLNIINDIINISKVESGQIEITLSETNINDQIKYIQTFFQPEVKQKEIQLILLKELASKDSLIKTDREKVYAVLTNLVKNAIKFTNQGSIEFGCEKKGEYLEFFVKDTGLGISKSQKKIIFERFRQASETVNRSYEGSGLGLAISKAYIEMLGGKIWVKSEEGKGSTFYFTIPFQSEIETKKEIVVEKIDSRETNEHHKIKDLKVLIVEDDAISKLLITIAVKPFSKEILKVSNGFEAIETCRNNPDIDLIMMDINMPEMGGYEATKQIREFNKELIIIAQTANGMQSDRDDAIAAGCTDYVSKPVNIASLGELIQKYFKK